jgi:hypothetical protein
MKNVLLVILAVFDTFFSQAQHSHYPDQPSTHGMMLMGTEQIYASHLPMFRTPHDYQIILVLELSDQDKETYKKDRKANPTDLVYTLEPETFVLPETILHTKKFKGHIYRGHFERGGTRFLENISVRVEKVVYFKQFEAKAVKPQNLYYLLFGNEKEQFLAHLISACPDFDQIISVSINDQKIFKKLRKKPFLLIEFEESDQRKPFSWQNLQAKIMDKKQIIRFLNYQSLYLEYDDLAGK